MKYCLDYKLSLFCLVHTSMCYRISSLHFVVTMVVFWSFTVLSTDVNKYSVITTSCQQRWQTNWIHPDLFLGVEQRTVVCLVTTNRNKAAVHGLVSQPIVAYVVHLTWPHLRWPVVVTDWQGCQLMWQTDRQTLIAVCVVEIWSVQLLSAGDGPVVSLWRRDSDTDVYGNLWHSSCKG